MLIPQGTPHLLMALWLLFSMESIGKSLHKVCLLLQAQQQAPRGSLPNRLFLGKVFFLVLFLVYP